MLMNSASDDIELGVRADDEDSHRTEEGTPQKHDGRAQTRIDRWTDTTWRFITLLSGNGGAGRAWKITARVWTLAAGPLLALNTALFTCEMGNTTACISFMAYVLSVAMTFLAMAFLIINARVTSPEKKQIIRELAAPQDRGTFDRARSTFGTIVTVIALVYTFSTNPQREVKMRMESEQLTDRPSHRAAVVAVHVLYTVSCIFLLASFLTALRNAATWLSATRHAIKRFATEVQSVAEASTMATAADAEAPDANPAAAVVEGVPAVTAVPIVPNQTLANTAKVKCSFEAAWRLTQATNEIFTLSLSYIFARQTTFPHIESVAGAWLLIVAQCAPWFHDRSCASHSVPSWGSGQLWILYQLTW